MKVLQLYPQIFSIEDSISIGAPVTLLEIENILKNFAKSKSLNLDEWTIDFSL